KPFPGLEHHFQHFGFAVVDQFSGFDLGHGVILKHACMARLMRVRDVAGQPTALPGAMAVSTSTTARSVPPLPADKIMPSDRPKRILRAGRLATKTTCRSTRVSGSG